MRTVSRDLTLASGDFPPAENGGPNRAVSSFSSGPVMDGKNRSRNKLIKNRRLSSLIQVFAEKPAFSKFPSVREALLILTVALSFAACNRTQDDFGPLATSSREVGTPVASTAPSKIDFTSQIQPILQARCQPCHFEGGKMYQRLPFDRAETIKTLGTKLFSRIEDEKERCLIRDFLAQQ
jgi:hypothetical protein